MRGQGNLGRRCAIVAVLALVLVAAGLAESSHSSVLAWGEPIAITTSGQYRLRITTTSGCRCQRLRLRAPHREWLFGGDNVFGRVGESEDVYLAAGDSLSLAFYHYAGDCSTACGIAHNPVVSGDRDEPNVRVRSRGTDRWEIQFEDNDITGATRDLILDVRLVAPLGPPAAIDAGPPCSGSADRTMTWSSVAGWWYRVQRATDPGFTRDVSSVDVQAPSASSAYTFAGHTTGTYYYRVQCRGGDNDDPTGWVETGARDHDTSAPATTHALSGTPGNAGWYISPAQVGLAAVDTGCGGLQATRYRVDGGELQTYAGPFALSDGVHVVEYYSIDAAGNAEAVQSLAVNVDTTPPATTATPAGTAGDGGWWRSGVEVTLDATDATSSVDATGYRLDGAAPQAYDGSPFAISGEGEHTVAYWSTDIAGNVEISSTQQVYIDTRPPSSSIDSLSDGRWVAGTVNLSGSASDTTSGVALMDVSTNGGLSWQGVTGTETWSSAWDTTAVPDGDHQLCTRARDVAGNVETHRCITIHVDNTPPSTAASPSGTAGGDSWWRSSVAVALSASDGAGNGVAGIQYRVNGGAWQDYDGPFTVTGDGAHTVEYRSADYLGNTEGSQNLQIRIDTAPPATSATPTGTAGDNGWYHSDVSISLSASDATSGVAATEYRLDGGSWESYSTPFTVAGDGTHVVEYRSSDAAGNVETSGSLQVRIDAVPPQTTVATAGVQGNGDWWRSTVTVTLTASDATSGVGRVEYYLDGEGWDVYTPPLVVTGEGVYDLAYRSLDVAGNVESAGTVQIHVDTLPPATSPTITGTLGLNGWYTDTATVALTAGDATSGVDAVFLDSQPYTRPVTYTVDGRYDLPFCAFDVAGNQEEMSVLSFSLDTTPPEANVIGGEFCPGRGEVLLLQPAASDATSGLSVWRLEILDGSQVVRQWTGSTALFPVPWDGKDADGKRVKRGSYTLHLWVQDGAGWTAVVTGEVKAKPKPSSPSPPAPLPTFTPAPVPTATVLPASTPTSTPSPTLRPGETPQPTPISTMTSTPVPEPTLEPVPVRVILRVGIFQDDDANGLKGPEEPGLERLDVRAQSGTWVESFIADAAGVVTITLPAPGDYEIALAGYPAGAAWKPTTRTAMQVRIGDDGSVVFLPAGEDTLPMGMAEGVAFAFGLVAVVTPAAAPVIVWPSYLLVGGVLIWLAQGTGRTRIASAVEEWVDVEKKLFDGEGALGTLGDLEIRD